MSLLRESVRRKFPPRTPYRSKITQRILLSVGDILYLPRGTPHDALAVGTGAMHLTVSLNLVRWSEVIAEVVADLVERDLDCRRAVPREMLRSADHELVAIARSMMTSALAEPAGCDAAHNIHGKLLKTAQRLISPKGSENDSHFRLAADQLCAATYMETEVRLETIGTSCSFHPRWSGLCRHLVGGEIFDRPSLTSMGTGAEITEILDGLLASGVIVRASPSPDNQDASPRNPAPKAN